MWFVNDTIWKAAYIRLQLPQLYNFGSVEMQCTLTQQQAFKVSAQSLLVLHKSSKNPGSSSRTLKIKTFRRFETRMPLKDCIAPSTFPWNNFFPKSFLYDRGNSFVPIQNKMLLNPVALFLLTLLKYIDCWDPWRDWREDPEFYSLFWSVSALNRDMKVYVEFEGVWFKARDQF